MRPEPIGVSRLHVVPTHQDPRAPPQHRSPGDRSDRLLAGRRDLDRGKILVALHDIEPATFERCALIRDWLDDHGVDKVTLLVIPARDLHPLAGRSPEMVRWLAEQTRCGDAIAQHGFQHLRAHRARWPLAALRGGHEAEFLGLDAIETHRAVEAGRRVLKLAGVEPQGFVAPAYAYTPALRRTLGGRFRWWAGLLGFHHARAAVQSTDGGGFERELLAPPIALASSGRLRRALAPTLLRAGSLLPGSTLRLDLHPSDLQRTHHMLALEWVLNRHAKRRTAVTYDELAAGTC